MSAERANETYLGDGLYASFDGWQVWLRAPRLGGDHVVALEPQVLARLISFVNEQMAATTAKVSE